MNKNGALDKDLCYMLGQHSLRGARRLPDGLVIYVDDRLEVDGHWLLPRFLFALEEQCRSINLPMESCRSYKVALAR